MQLNCEVPDLNSNFSYFFKKDKKEISGPTDSSICTMSSPMPPDSGNYSCGIIIYDTDTWESETRYIHVFGKNKPQTVHDYYL